MTWANDRKKYPIMRFIPVDQTALTLNALQVEAKTDQDGTQKVNRDGIRQWSIITLAQSEGGTPEVLKVTVPSTTEPDIEPMEPVSFTNLRAIAWEANGRSGIAFSADSL